MVNLNGLKKSDLIKILVDEYGYEKEDIKTLTNAKLKGIVKQEEEDAKELEKDSTRIVAQKSTIKDDERIAVMNGLTGGLFYHSDKTNRTWEFTGFGQQDWMEYSDLLALKNKYPAYIYDAWLIVLDKDVQEEFHLTELYKNIITPQNMDYIFGMSVEELDTFVDSLTDGMKRTFVNLAMTKYEQGKLNDFRVIQFIQNKFNFSFEDNAPLDDIVFSVDKGNTNVIYVNKV